MNFLHTYCTVWRRYHPIPYYVQHNITDKKEQMKRWAEHYQELYSRLNTVTDAAVNISKLPTMHELDRPPSLEELQKAIDSLACNKAPGKDGISPEVIKISKNNTLVNHLHKLLCHCWDEGTIPQDMRDANIVTLYKNKGDRSDCNNYRSISLLSIVGKAFARVLLKRLQLLADRIYPESQCGFRAKRSTVDMIFSLRHLQEKCREQRQPLFIAFIDLTKAFDLVSRSGLFTLLQRIGCPPKLLQMIRSFHDNMQGTVQYDGSSSDLFPIKSGVKRAVYSHQHFLASFSHSCSSMHLTPQTTASISTQEAMESCSTCPD